LLVTDVVALDPSSTRTLTRVQPQELVRGARGCFSISAWLFVYQFFSNGTPFDSPNRSEPCPRS
jgi:hypothetical protein